MMSPYACRSRWCSWERSIAPWPKSVGSRVRLVWRCWPPGANHPATSSSSVVRCEATGSFVMSRATLKERVAALERQVGALLADHAGTEHAKNWRCTREVFTGDDL